MNDASRLEHPLLDPDCCHYLESMITACDDMGSDGKKYHSFLKYWNRCIQKNPSPHNAFLYAFKYFKKDENKNIDASLEQQADKYLNDLKFYHKDHGLVGESIQKFIESFQSLSPRNEIKTEDIQWFPSEAKDAWTNIENKYFANIFNFTWSVARFWQLLESRKNFVQIRHLKRFLCILGANENLLEKEDINRNLVHSELTEKLKKNCPENIEFFSRHLFYFSPEFLTQDEMCSFWKKCSISSIQNKSVKTSLKKPLDSIWLLGRFYGVHSYRLDFLGSGRGFTDKAYKQILNTSSPDLISQIKDIQLEEIARKDNKQIEWGGKKISIFEACSTIFSDKEWNRLEQRSKEINEQDERNVYKTFLEKAVPFRNKGSLLNNLDFSNRTIREWSVKEPQKFNTFIILISVIEQFKSTTNDDFDIIQDLCKNENLASFEISLFLSQGMNHEKNLFLVASKDLDYNFLKQLLGILALILLVQVICEWPKNIPSKGDCKNTDSTT